MYYELTSNNVPLNSYTVSESDFGNHADMSTSNLTFTKEVPAITWPKQPTVEEMWDNNSNALQEYVIRMFSGINLILKSLKEIQIFKLV